MTESVELTHGQVLGFLRRGLWLAIVLAIVIGAGLYYYGTLAGPAFRAQAVLVTQSPQVDMRTLGLPDVNNAPLHVDAYSVAATSAPVIAGALDALGLPSTQGAVEEVREDQLQIRVVSDPQLIYITITADEPGKAADLANAISEQLQAWDRARVTQELQRIAGLLTQRITAQQALVEQLSVQDGAAATNQLTSERLVLAGLGDQLDSVVALSSNATSTLKVLRAATPPVEGIGRSPIMFALLGLILGVILAYGLMFVIELVDGRLYTSEGVERSAGLPVLAALARARRGRATATESAVMLQTNLGTALDLKRQTTLAVTAVQSPDDTATAAIALAESFAQRGRNTLLIDADLRQPAVARRYRVPGINNLSLMTCLSGRQGMRQPIRVRVGDRAKVALLFETKPAPNDVMAMLDGLPECLHRWKEEYDAIVLRVAPVGRGSDAVMIGEFCNGVILAINPRTSNRKRLLDTVARLRRAGVKLVGGIATGLRGPLGPRQQYQSEIIADLTTSTRRTQAEPPRTF